MASVQNIRELEQDAKTLRKTIETDETDVPSKHAHLFLRNRQQPIEYQALSMFGWVREWWTPTLPSPQETSALQERRESALRDALLGACVRHGNEPSNCSRILNYLCTLK